MDLANLTRPDFPILQAIDGARPLIYLDNAATALKPQIVIDAVVDILRSKTANVHRSVHRLGDLATEAFEAARQTVANFINALPYEIVFVRNTTEALNIVARGFPSVDQILVSLGEHHSSLLPWQGRTIRLKPLSDGRLDKQELVKQLCQARTSLVCVSHVSNVTGARNDVREIASLCHAHGAALIVDAAQSAPHEVLDIVDLDCDFLAFSGHKLGSPTGVGVLYGKAEQLERIEWHLRGGGTVEEVHADRVVPKELPWRLEAGTPAIEAVVGLAAAIHYLTTVDMNEVNRHQQVLCRHAVAAIKSHLPQMTILGDEPRCGPVGMVQRTVSPHLLARALSDRYDICVRSGFHCAQPLHEFLGLPASLRMSFYLYNTIEEIDLTVDALRKLFETIC